MKETPFDSAIESLESALKSEYQKRANFLCPFKVGDIVQHRDKVMKIIEIKAQESKYNPLAVLVNWRLKSGDFSPVIHEIWSYHLDEVRLISEKES